MAGFLSFRARQQHLSREPLNGSHLLYDERMRF
jgi:hypothetical protein